MSDALIPQNPAETLVYKTLVWTWPLYGLGALYIAGPVVGWTLAGMVALTLYLGPARRADLRATGPVPDMVWLWLLGMSVMLVALWVGHENWHLGLGETIKSTIGWAKGWALVALFPLAGAILPVRREVLIRGQCVVGMWTALLTPILFLAPMLHLPSLVFTSPLKAVGGPGPEYFSVYFYTIDPENGAARWQFYVPWSPFAALLGVLMVLFALEEKVAKWRWGGIIGGVAMILLSKSRMGLIGVVACSVGPRMMPLLLREGAWQALAAIAVSFAAIGGWVQDQIHRAVVTFREARTDSTRVRDTLQNIASERWRKEAVWFGHGTVEPGPHIVEHMPIGSHHTWWGLLFVKGLVGFCALLVPMVAQMLVVMVDAARGPRGRLPMGIMMTVILLTFGENLEIEAYMIWPGLMLLGLHAREMAREGEARAIGRAAGRKVLAEGRIAG